MSWHACWIWEDEAANPVDAYCLFRKTFPVPGGGASSATLRISADTRYKLFLNGRFVGHGPARSSSRHQTVDVRDVAEYLKPGENVLGVVVAHFGVGTCFSLRGRAGLLAELTVGEGADSFAVGTDATWRVHHAPHLPGADRMSVQLPFPEVYDTEREPRGWMEPGFDDSGWPCARVVAAPGEEPWPGLAERDIPFQAYRTVLPERLQAVYLARKPEGAARDGETPAEQMQRAASLVPPPSCAVRDMGEGRAFVSSVTGTHGTTLVFDFGREVSGFARLRCDGAARLDIGYSERLEADGLVDPNHFGGCDVHYADRVLAGRSGAEWESFSPRAFRYMRVDVYDAPEPVELAASLQHFTYPVRYTGEFACSDPLLNRIWEVGRYTAELCMDDAFMDCPWRERGQWLADTRVEALVAAYAFGDTLLARRAWRQYGESQGTTDAYSGPGDAPAHHAQPWVKCVYPAAPPFDSVLPTFNCIWLCGLWEYFLLTGDARLLHDLWPRIRELLALLRQHESPNGLLHNLPGWVFVDWAKLEVRGEASHVNAFYYAGLLAAAKIARVLGMPDVGGDLEMHATDVRDAVNDLLWVPEVGLYADCLVDGTRLNAYSEQAQTLCCLTGIAEAEQARQCLAFLDGRVDVPMVKIATPYFAFYLLRLLYGSGRHTEALAYTRREWGRMLERGATTFWEQFEPHWSLCHAWSAAPTYDLPAEIAGIRPVQPGFSEFTIAPAPCDLTWIRARVPTPRGLVEMAYHFRTDAPFVDSMAGALPLGESEPAITLTFTAPAGTRAHVALPVAEVACPTIRINGTKVYAEGAPCVEAGAMRLALESGILQFEAPAGQYLVEVFRSEEAADARAPMS